MCAYVSRRLLVYVRARHRHAAHAPRCIAMVRRIHACGSGRSGRGIRRRPARPLTVHSTRSVKRRPRWLCWLAPQSMEEAAEVFTDVLPGRLQATFWPGGRVPSEGHMALWGTDDPAQAAVALGLPRGDLAELPTVLPASAHARKRVVPVTGPARVVPIRSAVRAFAALPGDW